MNLRNNQSLSKPHVKKVLNDFSIDLCEYMHQINSMGKKRKKQKSLYGNDSQHFLLPSINQEKKNVPIKKGKKNKNYIPNIHNKAHKLLIKINQLEKSNENFWQNRQKNIELYKSMDSSFQQKNNYPIIQVPPTIYYNINQYPIMPSQFQYRPNYQQQPLQNKNENKMEKSSGKKKYSFLIPQARSKYLKRRIKVIFISVLFIFIFKTYVKTVLYKRWLASVQLQQIIDNEYKQLQKDLFLCFEKINIYKIFQQCTKNKENSQQQPNQLTIEHENLSTLIDLDVCENFLKQFLNSVEYMVKIGEFNIFKPIIASFLEGSFPLSRVFLEQQIQLIRTHEQIGYLTVSDQVSRIFIINYFFIKVFFVNLVIEKKLHSILLKIYKKNDKQQKLAVSYGNKMTIIFVLFYDILNSIYFSSIKKIINNSKSMPSKHKVKPLNELVYQINLNNFVPKSKTKSLIKHIQCPQDVREVFVQKFQNNWVIIKNISQLLYKIGLEYKKTLKMKILSQAKLNAFPERKKLMQIYGQRLSKRSYSSQRQGEGESQNKKILKNILKKKK